MTSFREACFRAARDVGARVEVPDLPGVSSFYAVTIRGRSQAHTVLRQADLPLVAFTREPPVPGRPVAGFVDPPSWATPFEDIGLRALSVRELRTPVSEVDAGLLATADPDDVRYWRPDVLSDLLFNWWD